MPVQNREFLKDRTEETGQETGRTPEGDGNQTERASHTKLQVHPEEEAWCLACH